jgi:exopolysaccharide biosynthesis WecB/TagA/CpsF family protein
MIGDMTAIQLHGVTLQSHDIDSLAREFEHGSLVFHNVDTIGKLGKDDEYRTLCASVDYSVVDGQVLAWLLSLFWGTRVKKASGSDFLREFCVRHADDPSVRVFLLGAGPGVAEQARARLNAAVGRDIVVGAHSPSFQLLGDDAESRACNQLITRSGATVLAVGLGAPKQEKWIAAHRHELPQIDRYIAVGATLDFEAGRISRAPRWMSSAGLEWAYRLLMEPRRLWRRYLVEGPRTIVLLAGDRLAEIAGRH